MAPYSEDRRQDAFDGQPKLGREPTSDGNLEG